MDHSVSYQHLLAFASEELSPAEETEVSLHVETCQECARVVQRYRALRDSVRTDAHREPPPWLVERVEALARTGPESHGARDPSVLERIVAALTLDSRSGLALAGVRGKSEGYQLTFESSAANVDLQLFPPAGPAASWSLLGEVEETGSAKARVVRLQRGEDVVGQTELGPDRAFEFEVGPGSYELHVELSGALVVLPDIQVP